MNANVSSVGWGAVIGAIVVSSELALRFWRYRSGPQKYPPAKFKERKFRTSLFAQFWPLVGIGAGQALIAYGAMTPKVSTFIIVSGIVIMFVSGALGSHNLVRYIHVTPLEFRFHQHKRKLVTVKFSDVSSVKLVKLGILACIEVRVQQQKEPVLIPMNFYRGPLLYAMLLHYAKTSGTASGHSS